MPSIFVDVHISTPWIFYYFTVVVPDKGCIHNLLNISWLCDYFLCNIVKRVKKAIKVRKMLPKQSYWWLECKEEYWMINLCWSEMTPHQVSCHMILSAFLTSCDFPKMASYSKAQMVIVFLVVLSLYFSNAALTKLWVVYDEEGKSFQIRNTSSSDYIAVASFDNTVNKTGQVLL